MAGRTSVGIGWGVAFSMISVIALGLFVTTVIFYAKNRAATQRYTELQSGVNEFVKDGERERDDIKTMRNAAVGKKQSLVAYLIANQETTMSLADGSPKTTVDKFKANVEEVTRSKTANLRQTIVDLRSQLTLEQGRVVEAIAARKAAEASLEAEDTRVTALEESQKEALAAQRTRIDTYKAEVDENAEKVKAAKKEMSEHETKVIADTGDTVVQLNNRISELEKDQLLSRETINRLQAELKGRSLKPGDEYALVDAEVIGLDTAENNVFLNIGSNKKARVGLTFEVYSEATSLRPDPATGNYPSGKASLEIIKVDPTSSTARVIREKKGNPILKGDVVANAVYDPNKVYTLLVFGNFDANQDGIATAQEASDVKALISEWGGKTIDELAGNVDFLVLGARPTLPLPPGSGAPVALIEEYVRVKRLSDRYDDLFKQASATSIPVLNENRLYTLIGKRLGR